MAKIYVSQSSVRPIRWMLQLVGWTGILSGFYTLFFGPSDFVTIYTPFGDNALSSIGMGAVLVIFDLVIPNPYRKARRLRRKGRKIYKSVYNALPYGDGLNQLLKEYGQHKLSTQISRQESFCKSILNRYPCRQVLDFVHTHNPDAAYTICLEGLIAAKTDSAPAEATSATPSDSAGDKTGNTASRINDINALLTAHKKESPKGTPLKQEDIQLGPLLDQYWHGCDYYDAANHRVMKYICIPDGPQGFGPIPVPDEIETLEQLLPWLVEKHNFHLK